MFKFDFDLADDEVDESLASQLTGVDQPATPQNPARSNHVQDLTKGKFTEHSLPDLIKALPGVISYSPLHVPDVSGSAEGTYLSKRDLYDARFQLISSGSGEDAANPAMTSTAADLDSDLQYVEAPSDLVPGVYEGGLKTWECSIDLAGCVKSALNADVRRRKRLRTLELGCGTAIPSLSLLQEILASKPQPDQQIEIHLQDYNDLVFRLVTLPNIILAWYMSPASSPFISSYTPVEGDADAEQEPLPPADPTVAGDLSLTPALLEAFQTSLKDYGVSIRFFSGSWHSFDATLTNEKYDVILTSETIYRPESLESLCDLMWKAYKGSASATEANATGDIKDLEKSTSQLSLDAQSEPGNDRNKTSSICLVAAKLVYFGVGGGVSEFTRAVESGVPSACSRESGTVNTIWKMNEGVKRVVLEVRW